MGHNVYFQLHTNDASGVDHQENISRHVHGNVPWPLFDEWQDPSEWEDYDRYMIGYSLKYPDVLFTLDIDCDNPEVAMERNYYRAGQSQCVIAVFPPCTLP